MVAVVGAWPDAVYGTLWLIVHNACMRGPGGEVKANAISRHATL